MNRDKMIQDLERDHWDMIIVGGGATGLGAAVDAASRGYKTVLLEQSDFAKGTSSRSTKLIHGGWKSATVFHKTFHSRPPSPARFQDTRNSMRVFQA